MVAVVGLLAIALAQTLGDRLRVATPLLLVAVGIGVSLLPFIPDVDIDPEWILAGVLPPLLYSASASMPTMDFRREFRAIGSLSVVLVVASSVLLGLFFTWVIPDLSLAWGIALGAIVSPTDAVATTIVKRIGVSPRAVSILEGESLLNDATALVLLRAGIAGAAASVSVWHVFGQFVFAVVVAVIIGFIVGRVNLWARSKVEDPTVNTVVSFTVPFLASVPAEELGASGLVAAVVAGLVTGSGAARVLSPGHRLSDSQNWRAIEVILEGTVFLVMGLQLSKIIGDVHTEHQGVGTAIGIAGAALFLTILIRTAYVTPLLLGLKRRARRSERLRPRISDLQERLADPETAAANLVRPADPTRTPRKTPRPRPEPSPERVERFRTRLRRGIADIDYLLAKPLGWREGTVVVWSGMRGAVTLAAAQTLPADTPNRSLLVFIAFLVAAGSLLIQGGTLTTVVKWVKPAGTDHEAEHEERVQLMQMLIEAAASVTDEPPLRPPLIGQVEAAGRTIPADDEEQQALRRTVKGRQLAIIRAQRTALLDARDDGVFSAGVLNSALKVLDADQISIELRGGPPEED